MQIVFRVDASNQIGSGHVIRCLTLAQELINKEEDVAIHFICRDLPGNMIGFIENKGFPVFVLPFPEELKHLSLNEQPNHIKWSSKRQDEDASATGLILRTIIDKHQLSNIDWLIVDHYAIDRKWESKLRLYVNKIMVIDDTADRPHDCDLLLDQNLYDNMDERYAGLVPDHCIKLLGPQYALLRPEFREARKNVSQRDGKIKRILVFMGGADPTNETAKALEAISMLNMPELIIDVVVGSSNPHQAEIEAMCKKMANANFYCQVDNMAELMVEADLAIGGGGSTTWERCCVGLTGVFVSAADNQELIIRAISNKRAGLFLGDANELSAYDYHKAITFLLSNNLLKKYSTNAFDIIASNHKHNVAENILI